jgi:hypothetical protein
MKTNDKQNENVLLVTVETVQELLTSEKHQNNSDLDEITSVNTAVMAKVTSINTAGV